MTEKVPTDIISYHEKQQAEDKKGHYNVLLYTHHFEIPSHLLFGRHNEFVYKFKLILFSVSVSQPEATTYQYVSTR